MLDSKIENNYTIQSRQQINHITDYIIEVFDQNRMENTFCDYYMNKRKELKKNIWMQNDLKRITMVVRITDEKF